MKEFYFYCVEKKGGSLVYGISERDDEVGGTVWNEKAAESLLRTSGSYRAYVAGISRETGRLIPLEEEVKVLHDAERKTVQSYRYGEEDPLPLESLPSLQEFENQWFETKHLRKK